MFLQESTLLFCLRTGISPWGQVFWEPLAEVPDDHGFNSFWGKANRVPVKSMDMHLTPGMKWTQVAISSLLQISRDSNQCNQSRPNESGSEVPHMFAMPWSPPVAPFCLCLKMNRCKFIEVKSIQRGAADSVSNPYCGERGEGASDEIFGTVESYGSAHAALCRFSCWFYSWKSIRICGHWINSTYIKYAN